MPWVSHYVLSLFTFLTATMAYLFPVLCLETPKAQFFHQEAKAAEGRCEESHWEAFQLRVLQEGDKELEPDEDNCVVCFDIYKPQDV